MEYGKNFEIRDFQKLDFGAVREIYQQGIDTGQATFQTRVKEWIEWDQSLLPVCRRVAVERGRVIGWAGLTAVSSREVYDGVAEVSIYIAAGKRGQGVGQLLLADLVRQSEAHGFWTLQAGIFPENEGSLQLHLNNGFREVGLRKEIGRVGDQWRDVLLLERRSTNAGR